MLTIWWTNGFNVLLFIAGLRNIPSELYEAAALDGATPRQQFWRVTWPLLWPVTALVLTLQLILQLKIFDQIYLMTPGRTRSTRPTSLLLHDLPRGLPAQPRRLRRGDRRRARRRRSSVISVLQFQVLRIGAPVSRADDRPAVENLGSLTIVTLVARGDLVLPDLLGDRHLAPHRRERRRRTPGLLPDQFHLDAYRQRALQHQDLPWYLNSIGTAVIITFIVDRLRDDVRLRDLAAALPRPQHPLRRDPRQLHDPDPGALSWRSSC